MKVNDRIRLWAPGSLTTAPPLRPRPWRSAHRRTQRSGQSYDCPSIAAMSPGCAIRPCRAAPGSLTTAPPLRRTGRTRRRGTRDLRAVLRLPLHCGHFNPACQACGSPGSGQSYDCPSIAASWYLRPMTFCSMTPGSLTTAPPLRPTGRGCPRPGQHAPGSLTTAPPLRHRVAGEVADDGLSAPGSLTTAPPLRLVICR